MKRRAQWHDVRTQVPGLQHDKWSRDQTEHSSQSSDTVQAKGADTYGTDAGHQYRANGEGVVQLFTRLEGILRLLPGALSAGGSGSRDTAQAAIRDLETMEAREAPLQAPTPTRA